MFDVGGGATTGGSGATTAIAAGAGADVRLEVVVLLALPVVGIGVDIAELPEGGGELLLLLIAGNAGLVLALDVVTGATTIGVGFSSSGLLGIRSYMRLPSAALGGFGKNSTSGFGIFSLDVRMSQSETTGPGLPRRSAMCVTRPRFFFL